MDKAANMKIKYFRMILVIKIKLNNGLYEENKGKKKQESGRKDLEKN
jgi:hypothetical protein